MTDDSQVKKVPLRNEIPDKDKWDLSVLYSSDEAWDRDFEKIKSLYPKLGAYKGKLSESAQTLKEYLELNRELDIILNYLIVYAYLRKSEDGGQSRPLDMLGRYESLSVKISELIAFEDPELMSVEDDRFNQLVNDPLLAEWKVKLLRDRRYKPHTLSEAEEKLLALADSVLGGPTETYDALHDVNMHFGELVNGKGEKIELSHSTYGLLMEDSNREVRRQAYVQFHKEIEAHAETYASNFAASIKGDVFSTKARNYPSSLEASLFDDEIPLSVYENLMNVVKANREMLDDYYGFIKEALNLDELYSYDVRAPLLKDIKTEYTWDEGAEFVLKAVEPLGEEYVNVLRKGLNEERWFDRYENKGKETGGYSWSGYQRHPFIMMNYTGTLNDIYTIVHEAGHAMHSYYSDKTQPYQYSEYPLFLAEVASTTNEVLLTDYLYKNTTDPKLKFMLINNQIMDIRQTIFAQVMGAEFEKIIHERQESGEALSLDYFKETFDRVRDLYSSEVIKKDEYSGLRGITWQHFYRAFYVYKYATGLAGAIALGEGVLEGKAKNDSQPIEKYFGFLKSGCSKPPIDTLRDAGVDLTSPQPVEKAMNLFGKRVQELKSLWPSVK